MALIISSASIPALRAMESFTRTKEEYSAQSLREIPEEALISSLGLGKRFGTKFRFDVLGEKFSQHGFKLEEES
jgi:hypothetical protein